MSAASGFADLLRRGAVRRWICVATVLGALAVVAACTPPPPTTIVYGDSLALQSAPAAQYLYPGQKFVFRAKGGTGPCDFIKQIAGDRALYKPARIVFAFTGNISACTQSAFKARGVAGLVAGYESSLRAFRAVYADLPFTVISPPAIHYTGRLYPGWLPCNGEPALVAMYARVSTELHLKDSLGADQALTPGHVFRWYGPRFVNGPNVLLRTPDGIHLTPFGQAWYGAALGGM